MKKLLSYLSQWKINHRKVPLMLLLFSCGIMNAQIKVHGTVKDSNTNQGLPGVTIKIDGTSTAVSSDFDGKYAIDVPENATLSFAFIGFQTKKVAVNGQATINLSLVSTAEDLKEVLVNVGYRSVKQKDLTGAVSTVKAKDFADTPQVSLDQLLQGRAAGVTVTNNSGQPGGDVSVKIRGTTSIGGTNEPLYIVDGIPISGDATNSSTGGNLVKGYVGGNSGSVTTSALALINPNDIETMDILKDASATAIYGSRASNGVVIITTKKGKKGSGKLTYDSYVSSQQVTHLLKTMSLSQYAVQQNALADYYGVQPRSEFAVPSVLGPGTNWQDEIYQTALMKNHQLSFSGAKDGTSYYISGGYLDQDGIVVGSDYERYNFKTNVDTNVKPWLGVGVSISGGVSKENITLNGSSDGIISSSILSTPDTSVKDVDGSYSGPPAGVPGAWINPVASALMNTNFLKKKNYMANLYANVKLAKGLEYRFDIGGSTFISNFEGFQPTYVWGTMQNKVNQLQERANTWSGLNIKNVFTYKLKLEDHNFSLLAGQESYESHYSSNEQTVSGLLSNNIHSISLGDPKTLTATENKGSSALSSYFSAFNYDYKDRYGFQATFRADGSSNFAEGKRWGYFPSVSGFWKLSNESFMEGTKKYVDNIKFRAGYGETGNQNIGGNAYVSGITSIKSAMGNFFTVGNIANPDLTWETAKQTNLGINFTVLDSKLEATVDLYRKQSEGFLFTLPLPAYVIGTEPYQGGLGAPKVNLGSMRNDGIEATVTYNAKFGEHFTWSSTAIFSKYNNELLSLQNNFDLIKEVPVNGYTNKTVTKTVVGQPIGQFYGYETVGIIRTNEQLANAPIPFTGGKPAKSVLGDIEYVDQNKDGLIDEKDLTFIGSPHPNFTFGFNNTFKYKGFDAAVFIQGSQGNKVLNLTRRAATKNQRLYENQLAEAADFWTPDNVNAKYPRPDGADGHPNLEISDRYVEDGSYIRLQNITFGFSLPSDVISKVKLTKLRFYGGLQNLYTFTKYTGYDPEVGSYNQDALLSGIDSGRYPTNKSFTFGLNVEF
ncbi:TonB-dependent receptor [Flavobacterium sp. 5]|uniref:SusC/RagA family TonB-linked outer membrane protein n=1 Tax=Flavobacterium sp. 5 TaxID=2035199 RepID=UPI000C2C1985|nr:TonB-dependent receptor [Flavobacterium sp. 5]PKB17820.1 TonB-linked SusC/RagA family outer membrane protein [Flavobacterium sp. 5]